jgi:hypothetical protein
MANSADKHDRRIDGGMAMKPNVSWHYRKSKRRRR